MSANNNENPQKLEKGCCTVIPQHTSEWNEGHLDDLQIVALQTRVYTPKEILSYIVNETIERRVLKVKEHLMTFMPAGLKAIDFDDFYSINHASCKNILYNAQKKQMLSFKVEPLPDFAEEAWCESFRVHGEQFCKHLMYMTWQKERGINMSKDMFLQLFLHFTAMFGLHANAAPCLQPQTLTIGNASVSSTPDLIFHDLPNCSGDTSKIFALCEIHKKKMTSDFCEPSPSKTRKYSERERKQITHLDTNVLGQHGGDLLVHCSSKSSKQPELLGFIVQDTNITFSQFLCGESDYKVIKEGNPSFPEGTGPVIKFSKPYNFLKAEDRMHIIEPLLKLGFLQTT